MCADSMRYNLRFRADLAHSPPCTAHAQEADCNKGFRDLTKTAPMAIKFYSWLMVLGTIAFTVYGQLVLKWQVDQASHSLGPTSSKLTVILSLLMRPWVISAFVAAFAASLCWMLALSKLSLSKAYPFMSLSFLLVSILSVWLFNDSFNAYKTAGLLLVVAGLVVLSQG